MTESSAASTINKRISWKRWSRSPWFAYQLCFLLILFCVILQAFNYWWGYSVDRALSDGIGTIHRQPVFPIALNEKRWGKHFERIEPIVSVDLYALRGKKRERHESVKADELQAIKWLPFLKTLCVYADLSPDAWSVLSEFQQLRRLEVRTIPDDGFICLAKLTRLEEFTFSMDAATPPTAVRHIVSLPNLKRLKLEIPESSLLRRRLDALLSTSTDSTLQQLRELAKSQSIKRLQCRFRDNDSLLALTAMQTNGEPPLANVLELRIDDSSITNGGLANLHHIPNLIHLDLSHSKIDDDAIQILKSLPHLRTLYLGGCSNITDQSAPELASMHNLTSLSVADSSMSIQGMTQLASLPRLKRLRIGWMTDIPAELRARLPLECELDVR